MPSHFSRSIRLRGLLAACAAMAALALPAGHAAGEPSAALARVADTFADRINAAYARVPQNRRSEAVLIPALIGMDEPPPVLLQRADRAALILPTSPVWSAANQWAMQPGQRAALDALAEATQETNPRRAMVFALPYGISGVPTEWIRAEMHAELGDPPTLASRQLGYMERFNWLRLLASIETTRLQDAGEPVEAIRLNQSLAALGRQLAGRAFGVEVFWGYITMIDALTRIRDVVYVDLKAGASLTAEDLLEVVEWFDLDRGIFRIDRLVVPEADRVAAEQLIQRVFDTSGRPLEGVFATSLAEMAATGRPLRLFAEAGRWSGLASQHAGASESREAVNGVYADWSIRWSADPFDRLQRNIPAYMLLDENRFALIREVVPNLTALFEFRRALHVELVGTRVALALRAQTAATGGVASSLAIIRPRYINDLGEDPFNPDRAAEEIPELRYFVPERDTVGGRRHRMNVVPRIGANFSIELTRDDIVLYSHGGNQNDDRAENVSDNGGSRIGDYLLWPPVMSLTRDYLAQTGASE